MKNSAISGSTAAATSMTGLAQVIDMIPDNIGKVACLFGILVSGCVIAVQIYTIKKARLEIKRIEVELKKASIF